MYLLISDGCVYWVSWNMSVGETRASTSPGHVWQMTILSMLIKIWCWETFFDITCDKLAHFEGCVDFVVQNSISLMMRKVTIVTTLTQMKTLHFISLNSCFVSMRVIVSFKHEYRDFITDNDYAIFIQILCLFRRQRLKNVFLTLHVLRNRWFTNSFKTNKKTFAAWNWY